MHRYKADEAWLVNFWKVGTTADDDALDCATRNVFACWGIFGNGPDYKDCKGKRGRCYSSWWVSLMFDCINDCVCVW